MSIVEDIVKVSDGLAFGIPGGGASLELIDAIDRNGGRFHMTQFEGSAAIMAGAVGRLGGVPGVAISIKGPGLANMTSGLATAMLEDFPVFAVAEAFGRTDGAEKAHKRLNHHRLVGAIVKAHCGLNERDAVARLSALAVSERPGPVLLELAEADSFFPSQVTTLSRDGSEVLRAIEKAKRPIVIAGGLAMRMGLSDALNQVNVPVFSTAGAKGVVDEKRPHAAGVYTGVGLELAPERSIIGRADLVIGIGLRTHEVLAANLSVETVNIDDLDVAPGFAISAKAGAGDAQRILEALAHRSGWGIEEIASARKTLRSTLLAGPFLPSQVFRLVNDLLPRARLVLDTGYFCTVGEHIWDVSTPGLYLSSGQGRSMGAALPMAVAAAVYRPDDPTILAIGDGGLGMFFAELHLAAAERAPLLVLFMRDGTYASIRDRAVSRGMSDRSLIARDPDWSAAAAAMEFVAGRADSLAEVSMFIDKWAVKGPAFLETRFDPEPYRTMTAKLRE